MLFLFLKTETALFTRVFLKRLVIVTVFATVSTRKLLLGADWKRRVIVRGAPPPLAVLLGVDLSQMWTPSQPLEGSSGLHKVVPTILTLPLKNLHTSSAACLPSPDYSYDLYESVLPQVCGNTIVIVGNITDVVSEPRT